MKTCWIRVTLMTLNMKHDVGFTTVCVCFRKSRVLQPHKRPRRYNVRPVGGVRHALQRQCSCTMATLAAEVMPKLGQELIIFACPKNPIGHLSNRHHWSDTFMELNTRPTDPFGMLFETTMSHVPSVEPTAQMS